MSQLDPIYYAYLVDPFAMTVTTVEIDRRWDIAELHKLLSHDPEQPVDCMTGAYSEVEGFPHMLCDDEGLYKDQKAWTLIKGKPEPITGKILLSDVDERGRSVTPAMSLSVAKRYIMFVEILGAVGNEIVMVPKKMPK